MLFVSFTENNTRENVKNKFASSELENWISSTKTVFKIDKNTLGFFFSFYIMAKYAISTRQLIFSQITHGNIIVDT